MINKKLLVTSYIASSLISWNAFAKTEGNYFGIDVIASDAKFKTTGEYISSNQDWYGTGYNGATTQGYKATRFNDTGIGWGLNYKYAFNIGNNVFVAPAIFFEMNNIKGNTVGFDVKSSVKIKNRSGIKLDVGYDVNEKSSVYLTAGLAELSYISEITLPDRNRNVRIQSKLSKDHSGMIYGIGLIHGISKNLSANLEFTTQRAKIDAGFSNSFKTDLRVVKVGASYRF